MSDEANLVAGRSCEGCTLCCKLAGVREIRKPRMVLCVHCKSGWGCTVYEQRPTGCRTFFCEYLLNAELGDEWKPANCHMMVVLEAKMRMLNVFVDNGYFDLWRKEPYLSQIKVMAINMLRQRGHLIVWEGLDGVGILPDKEVALGPWLPNHAIFVERRVTAQGEEFDMMLLDQNDPRFQRS